MTILVDLSVMELPASGVARVVAGLYGAIGVRSPEIGLHGIHRRALVSSPPPAMHTSRTGRFLPAQFWRSIVLPRIAKRTGDVVLHFPWNGGVPGLPEGVRVVTTLHDVLPLTISGFFINERIREAFRHKRQTDIDRSDVVVTDSEFSKSEILRHFVLKRDPVVIPCATNIAEFRLPDQMSRTDYFLYSGGLDPRKSVELLIRTFLHLSGTGGLRSKLVVTGSTRHASLTLLQLLHEGAQRGCLELTGHVEDRQLARLYAGALALVYPSQYEGFGLPPLEAMTMGCPVIASRASSIPEVCGDAALYAHPLNEQSLAEALRSVECDVELRRRLSVMGRERASLFSWDRAAERFLNTLSRNFVLQT